MKIQKMLALAVAFLAVGLIGAQADMTKNSGTVITNQVATSVIVASGYLDRFVINQTDSSTTNTITIGIMDGTERVETLVSLADWTGDNIVVAPRKVGTSSAGVALAGATTTVLDGTNIVATTVLSVPYEKYMIGGNLQISVTGGSGGDWSVQTFYEPTRK